ncbi:MAG: ribosome small subunit-dependent GTPase A [Magnetococcales bacterium]|nr:ribosome small subunit-dependent GTPase A [Magnetococcales bacterium]MBF0156534.1 ribosome small subunit-dependent GTPase A [Magnetococcales bacterium]
MPRKKSSGQLTNRQRALIRAEREARQVRRLARERVAAGGGIGGGVELGPEEEGLAISHYGLNAEVEDGEGRRSRCSVRETLEEEPVCGDRVVWRRSGATDQGVIVVIHPRRSLLQRPGAFASMKRLAANVDQLLIVTVAPDPNPGLLDRYLVAAEQAGITPLVVVNKSDLPHDAASLDQLLGVYRRMGYVTLQVSARTGEGLQALERVLKDRLSVFVGRSGMGKSALISRWIDFEEVRVGTVHGATGQGRHTTAVARLYHLPGGGSLIDSPGVRSFALYGVDRGSVARHFRDIAPYLGQCRFSDCRHRREPGCAILAASRAGAVDPRRVESLTRMMDSLDGSHFEG